MSDIEDYNTVYLTTDKVEAGNLLDPADIYIIRTENQKTGKGNLVVHSVPVKYVNDKGKVEFIDTSMKAIPTLEKLFGKYSYCNASNSFKVEYGNTADIGLRFNQSFTLNTYPNVKQHEKATTASEQGHGKIVHPAAFGPNTKVEYVNTETGIKENIILEKYTGQNRFDFVFRSKSHIPVLSEDKEKPTSSDVRKKGS